MMNSLTIYKAIAAIQKKFDGNANILNLNSDTILDIICVDKRTQQYYEVYSNENWTTLKIERLF